MTSKTFGEMTPAERKAAMGRVCDKLQAELTAAAPAISKIMDDVAAPCVDTSDPASKCYGWPHDECKAYLLGVADAEDNDVIDTNAASDLLMSRLGQHGETTEANADERGRMCDAYNEGIARFVDPEGCDCSCHLAGDQATLVLPQPDAAEYGEPAGPVPCCDCWQWKQCENGELISQCYHVPRCGWTSVRARQAGVRIGRFVKA